MNPLQFTIEDCKSPERLERLFRRLNQVLAEPAPQPARPNLPDLAKSLAPFINTQLQAPGVAPLNLQSLLPSTGLGVAIEDTHDNRLALYPAENSPVGTLFWETDRTVLYVVTETAGVRSWSYSAGMYSTTFANRPTDLSTADVGFLYMPSVYIHICRWSGSGWAITDGGGGYIVDAIVALGAGWILCDGTATTYLALSGADLAETAFTPTDENSGVAGVYHESIAVYSGTINAAAAPGIAGSTANATATNQATTATNQNTVVTAHTVIERLDDAGTGVFVFDTAAAADHATHGHTQDAHNHTQDAHLHAAGTLAVDATGEPRRMGVLRYFRR